MKSVNPSESDHAVLRDLSEPDLFIRGLCGSFEGNMKETFGRVIARNDWWDFAIGLSLHDDCRVAFRGSWALEWAYFNDRKAFTPHAQKFLDHFLKTENPSVHRIYAKMLFDMYRRGIVTINHSQAESVAEKAFGLVIEPDTKTAVKAWCLELLFDLSPCVDWVAEPLRETVCRIMETDPSHAMTKSAAKLLKRIDKRNKL